MMLSLYFTLLANNPLEGSITGPSSAFSPSGTGAGAGGEPIELFISILIGFFTIVAGLFFLVYMISAGLTWVSAGGEKGKIDGAKSQMTNGAIGLIVIVVAQFIVGIVGNVLGLNILNPAQMLGGLF